MTKASNRIEKTIGMISSGKFLFLAFIWWPNKKAKLLKRIRAGLNGKNQKIIAGYIRNDLFTATLKMLPQVVKVLREVLQSIVLKSTFNHCVRSWCHVLTQTNSNIKWTYTGSVALPLCIMLEQWLSGEKYDVKLRRVNFFFKFYVVVFFNKQRRICCCYCANDAYPFCCKN